VAEKFWRMTDAGLVNDRALREIEKGERQREVNREIGKRGGRPTKTDSETDSVSKQKPNANRTKTDSVPKQEPNRNPNQTPDTRHQTEDVASVVTGLTVVASARASPADSVPAGDGLAAVVCRRLRAAGIAAVNPSHPDLLALIAEGATAQEFADAGHIAAERGKGFAYLLATVRGQREDARRAAAAGAGAGNRRGGAQSFAAQDREAAMARWEEQTGQRHPDRDHAAEPPPVIDVSAVPADTPQLEAHHG
jgi:hypothetical protein